MAAGLLGGALSAGEEGGPAAYRNERGEGLFFSNGRFSFTFHQGIPLDGEAPERHAVRVMEAAGYEGTVLSTEQSGEDGALTVRLRQLWGGEEIFNFGAALTYRDGALWSIEGQRLVGTPVEAEGARGLSVSTVLIRFLSGVRENFYLCTEIRDLKLGYVAAMEAGGSGRLTPVWLVVTDGGSFYVDGADGTLSVTE